MSKEDGDYEFLEDWEQRDDELSDMSLEDYNDMRCEQEYGMNSEEMDSGDDD